VPSNNGGAILNGHLSGISEFWVALIESLLIRLRTFWLHDRVMRPNYDLIDLRRVKNDERDCKFSRVTRSF